MAQTNYLKSYMYCTNDPGMIPNALAKGMNVVAIVDVEDTPNFPGCIMMSGLLPPPKLVYTLMDRDPNDPNAPMLINNYKNSYFNYLGSHQAEEEIVSLLASMKKTSHDLLIYVEIESNAQFYILEVLTNFLRNAFGIIPAIYGDYSTKPGFVATPQNVFAITELLFVNNYINTDEYALSIPPDAIPSPRACSIILSNFDQVFANMKESVIACCNILNAIRQSVVTGKVFPAVQLRKEVNESRQKAIDDAVMQAKTRYGDKQLFQPTQQNKLLGKPSK